MEGGLDARCSSDDTKRLELENGVLLLSVWTVEASDSRVTVGARVAF